MPAHESPLNNEVLNYVRDNPDSTRREIADAMGEDYYHVRRAIGFLEKKGMVTLLGEGKDRMVRASKLENNLLMLSLLSQAWNSNFSLSRGA